MQYPKKLKDKIRLLCKLMQRPYYLMTRMAINTYMFELFDGTKGGNVINWTGLSPADAVDEAITYLKHEIEMGAIEVPAENEVNSTVDITAVKPVRKINRRKNK